VVRFYLLNVPYCTCRWRPRDGHRRLFTVSRMIRNNETWLRWGRRQRPETPAADPARGLVATLAMVAVREWSAFSIGPRRDALYDVLENQRREPVFESVWFKDRQGDVVHIREFRPATASAGGRAARVT